MVLLDGIIGYDSWMFFLHPNVGSVVDHSSQGHFFPKIRGLLCYLPQRGVFSFCCYASWPQKVIFGPKKLFLEHLFWKMMFFGRIVSYLFNKSGPEMTFVDSKWHLLRKWRKQKKETPLRGNCTTEHGEKKNNAPARNAPQQSPYWGEKKTSKNHIQ